MHTPCWEVEEDSVCRSIIFLFHTPVPRNTERFYACTFSRDVEEDSVHKRVFFSFHTPDSEKRRAILCVHPLPGCGGGEPVQPWILWLWLYRRLWWTRLLTRLEFSHHFRWTWLTRPVLCVCMCVCVRECVCFRCVCVSVCVCVSACRSERKCCLYCVFVCAWHVNICTVHICVHAYMDKQIDK